MLGIELKSSLSWNLSFVKVLKLGNLLKSSNLQLLSKFTCQGTLGIPLILIPSSVNSTIHPILSPPQEGAYNYCPPSCKPCTQKVLQNTSWKTAIYFILLPNSFFTSKKSLKVEPILCKLQASKFWDIEIIFCS